MMTKIKQSISLKISMLLIAIVVISAVCIGLMNDSIAANARRAVAIADSASSVVDGDDFHDVIDSMEKSDSWYYAKRSIDEMKVRTGVSYIYVLDAEFDSEMTYFIEGFDPSVDDEEYDLGVREPLIIDGENTYADEMFETIETGNATTTSIYNSGEFGNMVSGFAAVTDSNGNVVGVVGVDVNVDEVLSASRSFMLRIILSIIAFCAIGGVVSVYLMNRSIGKPLGIIKNASDKLALGNLDVDLDMADREDEIGVLAKSFTEMASHTKEQSELLARLADGNLDLEVTPRSSDDTMSIAMSKMLDNLNDMFEEIRMSSDQVAAGSDQIASGAQLLASGSTEQAATLEEFSAAISDVLHQSEDNTKRASEAYAETIQSSDLMARSMESMNSLAESMQEINASSESIASVIKVVDEIAFQTNILALNAAVEAARAGQHGKGFAVVAAEVRALASKSAEAAKETADLIKNSIEKVNDGTKLTEATKEILMSVNEIASHNAQAMNEINDSSEQQNQAIAQITTGITEFSGVVQANSATAEESAASAEEMSSQAQLLHNIISRFKLRDS